MLLLLSWYEFSDEKMQDSNAFNECVTRPTNRPTDQQTDRQTDIASYRDARTHLKIVPYRVLNCFNMYA